MASGLGVWERFVSAQNEYSWLRRGIEKDIVPALLHYEIGLLPYFPLANGLLTESTDVAKRRRRARGWLDATTNSTMPRSTRLRR